MCSVGTTGVGAHLHRAKMHLGSATSCTPLLIPSTLVASSLTMETWLEAA